MKARQRKQRKPKHNKTTINIFIGFIGSGPPQQSAGGLRLSESHLEQNIHSALPFNRISLIMHQNARRLGTLSLLKPKVLKRLFLPRCRNILHLGRNLSRMLAYSRFFIPFSATVKNVFKVRYGHCEPRIPHPVQQTHRQTHRQTNIHKRTHKQTNTQTNIHTRTNT